MVSVPFLVKGRYSSNPICTYYTIAYGRRSSCLVKGRHVCKYQITPQIMAEVSTPQEVDVPLSEGNEKQTLGKEVAAAEKEDGVREQVEPDQSSMGQETQDSSPAQTQDKIAHTQDNTTDDQTSLDKDSTSDTHETTTHTQDSTQDTVRTQSPLVVLLRNQ